MPHFFLPINWVLVPITILGALLVTMALIYWAVPELKFPQAPKSPSLTPSSWTHISESLLLSMICTFVFQTKSFEGPKGVSLGGSQIISHLSVKQAFAH